MLVKLLAPGQDAATYTHNAAIIASFHLISVVTHLSERDQQRVFQESQIRRVLAGIAAENLVSVLTKNILSLSCQDISSIVSNVLNLVV